MTVCNMSIEAGARAGMVAVDDTTIDYLRGRPFAPTGELWDRAVAYWRTLRQRRRRDVRHASSRSTPRTITPQVTWGTSPEMVMSIDGRVPDPDKEQDPTRRDGIERALAYMGLAPNTPMTDIRHRQGVHRLVHELADRGPARGRRGRARPPRRRQRQARDGRARARAS